MQSRNLWEERNMEVATCDTCHSHVTKANFGTNLIELSLLIYRDD